MGGSFRCKGKSSGGHRGFLSFGRLLEEDDAESWLEGGPPPEALVFHVDGSGFP